jgi:hypothetical protein
MRTKLTPVGVILTYDIVVKNFAYLLGARNAIARLHQRGLVLLADNVHAQFDALVADKHGRAGDELAHLVLDLAAAFLISESRQDTSHHSRNPAGQTRLIQDREGQPRGGAKGDGAPSLIIEEASENP